MAESTCSIEGCGEGGRIVRGWCRRHYWRWKKYGDPIADIRQVARRKDILALLNAASVAMTDECILMDPHSNTRPLVRWNGRSMAASRVVWVIANGDPGELKVLHRCNGGSGAHGCINIRHLYLGTGADNARDMVAAGRASRGENHRSAKLTEADVVTIRRLYDAREETVTALAARYGINNGTLSRVVHRRTWRHV